MDINADETSAINLTSTMGSVLSNNTETNENTPTATIVDSLPSSSSDVGAMDKSLLDKQSEDAISSTSDVGETLDSSTDEVDATIIKKKDKNTEMDDEADSFANECNLSDVATSKITENVDDIVSDLENLLGNADYKVTPYKAKQRKQPIPDLDFDLELENIQLGKTDTKILKDTPSFSKSDLTKTIKNYKIVEDKNIVLTKENIIKLTDNSKDTEIIDKIENPDDKIQIEESLPEEIPKPVPIIEVQADDKSVEDVKIASIFDDSEEQTSDISKLEDKSKSTEKKTLPMKEEIPKIPSMDEQQKIQVKTIPTIVEQTKTAPKIEEQVNTIPTIQETTEMAPTIKKQVKNIHTIEEQTETVVTIEEQVKANPTIEDQPETPAKIEKQVKNIHSIEEQMETEGTIEEQVKTIPTIKDQTETPPTIKNEVKNIHLIEEQMETEATIEEHVRTIPTIEDQPETPPTIEKQVANIHSIEKHMETVVTIEEQVKTIATIEEQPETPPITEKQVKNIPTIEESMETVVTIEKQVKTIPTIEEQPETPPTTKEQVKNIPTIEEETETVATIEEQVKTVPTIEDQPETPATIEKQAKNIHSIVEQTETVATIKEQVKTIPEIEDQPETPLTIKKQTKNIPTIEEQTKTVATIKEQVKTISKIEKQAKTIHLIEDQTETVALIEEQVQVIARIEGQTEAVPTIEEQVKIIEKIETIPSIDEPMETSPTIPELIQIVPLIEEQMESVPAIKEPIEIIEEQMEISPSIPLVQTTSPKKENISTAFTIEDKTVMPSIVIEETTKLLVEENVSIQTDNSDVIDKSSTDTKKVEIVSNIAKSEEDKDISSSSETKITNVNLAKSEEKKDICVPTETKITDVNLAKSEEKKDICVPTETKITDVNLAKSKEKKDICVPTETKITDVNLTKSEEKKDICVSSKSKITDVNLTKSEEKKDICVSTETKITEDVNLASDIDVAPQKDLAIKSTIQTEVQDLVQNLEIIADSKEHLSNVENIKTATEETNVKPLENKLQDTKHSDNQEDINKSVECADSSSAIQKNEKSLEAATLNQEIVKAETLVQEIKLVRENVDASIDEKCEIPVESTLKVSTIDDNKDIISPSDDHSLEIINLGKATSDKKVEDVLRIEQVSVIEEIVDKTETSSDIEKKVEISAVENVPTTEETPQLESVVVIAAKISAETPMEEDVQQDTVILPIQDDIEKLHISDENIQEPIEENASEPIINTDEPMDTTESMEISNDAKIEENISSSANYKECVEEKPETEEVVKDVAEHKVVDKIEKSAENKELKKQEIEEVAEPKVEDKNENSAENKELLDNKQEINAVAEPKVKEIIQNFAENKELLVEKQEIKDVAELKVKDKMENSAENKVLLVKKQKIKNVKEPKVEEKMENSTENKELLVKKQEIKDVVEPKVEEKIENSAENKEVLVKKQEIEDVAKPNDEDIIKISAETKKLVNEKQEIEEQNNPVIVAVNTIIENIEIELDSDSMTSVSTFNKESSESNNVMTEQELSTDSSIPIENDSDSQLSDGKNNDNEIKLVIQSEPIQKLQQTEKVILNKENIMETEPTIVIEKQSTSSEEIQVLDIKCKESDIQSKVIEMIESDESSESKELIESEVEANESTLENKETIDKIETIIIDKNLVQTTDVIKSVETTKYDIVKASQSTEKIAIETNKDMIIESVSETKLDEICIVQEKDNESVNIENKSNIPVETTLIAEIKSKSKQDASEIVTENIKKSQAIDLTQIIPTDPKIVGASSNKELIVEAIEMEVDEIFVVQDKMEDNVSETSENKYSVCSAVKKIEAKIVEDLVPKIIKKTRIRSIFDEKDDNKLTSIIENKHTPLVVKDKLTNKDKLPNLEVEDNVSTSVADDKHAIVQEIAASTVDIKLISAVENAVATPVVEDTEVVDEKVVTPTVEVKLKDKRTIPEVKEKVSDKVTLEVEQKSDTPKVDYKLEDKDTIAVIDDKLTTQAVKATSATITKVEINKIDTKIAEEASKTDINEIKKGDVIKETKSETILKDEVIPEIVSKVIKELPIKPIEIEKVLVAPEVKILTDVSPAIKELKEVPVIEPKEIEIIPIAQKVLEDEVQVTPESVNEAPLSPEILEDVIQEVLEEPEVIQNDEDELVKAALEASFESNKDSFSELNQQQDQELALFRAAEEAQQRKHQENEEMALIQAAQESQKREEEEIAQLQAAAEAESIRKLEYLKRTLRRSEAPKREYKEIDTSSKMELKDEPVKKMFKEEPKKEPEVVEVPTISPKKVVENVKRLVETPKKVVEVPKKSIDSPKKSAESNKKLVETSKKFMESHKRTPGSPKKTIDTAKKEYKEPLKIIVDPVIHEVSIVKEAESTTNEEQDGSNKELSSDEDKLAEYSSKISRNQELKLTIRKNKTEEPASILKIYDPTDDTAEISAKIMEEISPIPKLIIKSSQCSPKLHSPLKIKSIVKPEDVQRSSPKLTIKPIIKPDDEYIEEKHNSPKLKIKAIPKLDECERSHSPKITIKPIIKPIESNVSHVSPKIKIKPIIKPEEEHQTVERLVLKINKGNTPQRIEETEKITKIKLKFSKEGGHPHIVNDDEKSHKRAHVSEPEMHPKKSKIEAENIPTKADTPNVSMDSTTDTSADLTRTPKTFPETSTPTPKKRGRPRKIPLQVREDFPEVKRGRPKKQVIENPEIQEVIETEDLSTPDVSIEETQESPSGRPKRSCRGPSVMLTLGIKPRKPRGAGSRGGRGRGRGRGGKVEKPPKKERITESKLKLIRESALTAQIAETFDLNQDYEMKIDDLIVQPGESALLLPQPEDITEVKQESSAVILIEDSNETTDTAIGTPESIEPEQIEINEVEMQKPEIQPLIDTPIIEDIVMFEEDTRMSAETSGSRAPTPPKLSQAPIITEVVEESQSSMQSTATTESVSKAKKVPRYEIEPECSIIFPEQLAEYTWQGGGPYMLQEQVSQYLGIKSFKRKYPGIPRRPVDMQERDFIRESGLASEHMCDLGLTAVPCNDILDIMYSDFQHKYEEYCKHQRDRQAKDIINKQKALNLAASQEKTKMDLTQQAIESAASWNANFNKARKEERKACMDLQTFTVNFPKGRIKQINKAKIGSYPIALVPGQYTDYYKKFTPTEINNLPLNTMLYVPIHDPNEDDSSDNSSESDSSSSGSDSSDSDSSDEDCNLCSPNTTPKKNIGVN